MCVDFRRFDNVLFIDLAFAIQMLFNKRTH